MSIWVWFIIAGAGILLVTLIAIVTYLLGKRRGVQLGYADPMKRPDENKERVKQYISVLRPFLPVRMLACLQIQEREIPPEQLCDQRADVTAALLCGGHSFVEHSVSLGKYSSDEIYDELNRMLAVVVPTVLENNGALEGVKDGLFRALFMDEPERALRSAINVMDSFKENLIPIGLSYGRLSIGIVGHDERMSIITISSCARVGESLRTLAERFYAVILATGEYVKQIHEFDRKFNSRLMGVIHYEEDDRTDEVYDVFDGDPVDRRNRKRKTKMLFEKGIQLFLSRQFSESRGYCIEVLKADHEDTAARHYLFLCDTYQKLDKEQADEADIFLLSI